MSIATLISAAVLMVTAMTIAWAVRLWTGRSGWIDTIWSAAVGLAGVVAALGASGEGRPRLIAALILLWSARLALHIAARTRGAADDPRYAELARQWGDAFASRLFVFLQIQAAAGFVLVAAVHVAASAPGPFPGAIDVVATLVVLVAIAGEAAADAQLRRFRRSAPSGALCEVGLWSWSRHPNYFFEWLGWCGFALFALHGLLDRPHQILAFAAPVMMWGLLVHVSGIPPLEDHMARSRGAAFDAYRARVSAFFPRPPRRDPASEVTRRRECP